MGVMASKLYKKLFESNSGHVNIAMVGLKGAGTTTSRKNFKLNNIKKSLKRSELVFGFSGLP